MTRRGTGRGKGKGKGSKDAKAKARVKAKKKATRQAGSKRKAPKREQFDKNKEGHPEEADRQIEIARAAPHNLDTQPDICAFITDETKKLDQRRGAAAESEAVVTKERALALLEGAFDGESALSVAVLRKRFAAALAPLGAAQPTRGPRALREGPRRAPSDDAQPPPRTRTKRGRGGVQRPVACAQRPRSMSVSGDERELPFTEPPIEDEAYDNFVANIKAGIESERELPMKKKTVSPYALLPTGRFRREVLKETLDLHIETCRIFRVGIAKNWGFKTPCSRWEVFGQSWADARVDALYLDARRLPPSRRLTYFNGEFFGAPNAPARDLLQKIYGCRPLSDEQYGVLRELWVCDTIRTSQEFVRAALVLRPFQFESRWGGGRNTLEMQRYTGDWRVRVVTKICHTRSELATVHEQAGAQQFEFV